MLVAVSTFQFIVGWIRATAERQTLTLRHVSLRSACSSQLSRNLPTYVGEELTGWGAQPYGGLSLLNVQETFNTKDANTAYICIHSACL